MSLFQINVVDNTVSTVFEGNVETRPNTDAGRQELLDLYLHADDKTLAIKQLTNILVKQFQTQAANDFKLTAQVVECLEQIKAQTRTDTPKVIPVALDWQTLFSDRQDVQAPVLGIIDNSQQLIKPDAPFEISRGGFSSFTYQLCASSISINGSNFGTGFLIVRHGENSVKIVPIDSNRPSDNIGAVASTFDSVTSILVVTTSTNFKLEYRFTI